MKKELNNSREHESYAIMAFGFLVGSLGAVTVTKLVQYSREHIASGRHGTTFTDEASMQNLTVTADEVHFHTPMFGTHKLPHETADRVVEAVARVEQSVQPPEQKS